MGLKNISNFRKLYFIKTMHNVICCLKFANNLSIRKKWVTQFNWINDRKYE